MNTRIFDKNGEGAGTGRGALTFGMALAVTMTAGIGTEQSARADLRSAGGSLAACGGPCGTAGGSVCFTWNPDFCDPDCHITPRLNITGACAAVTSVGIYADDASTCPTAPTGTLVTNLENLIPFTLTESQTNDLLVSGNYIVKVEFADGTLIKEVIEKLLGYCPALSQLGVGVMALLGVGAGVLMLRRLNARPKSV